MKKCISVVMVIVFFTLLFLWGYLLLQKTNLSATDLGRHVKNGQLAFSHPQVIFKNFYSYVQPDFPFINHHWLSGVVFYWTKIFFGWKGLSLFAFLLMLTSLLVAFWNATKKSNFWIAAAWVVPAGVLLSERTEIRPELFSTLFIVVYVCLLQIFLKNKSGKIFFSIIVLQLVWSNLHIYSFLGLALIFFAALEEIYNYLRLKTKKLSILAGFIKESSLLRMFAGAALVSLMTPNFIRGFLYPLSILKNYGYEIVENKSIFYIQRLMIDFNIDIFKAFFLIAAAFIIWSFFIERKIHVFETLVFTVFSFLGFFALRNIAMFGVIAMPIASRSTRVVFDGLLKNKDQTWKNKFFIGIEPAIAIVVILFFSIWIFSGTFFTKQGKGHDFGLGLESEGEKMSKFILENGIYGNIFNNYDIGSYLDYVLAPNQKIFVDNRPEAFGVDFFENYRKMETDVNFWKSQDEKYDFQYIIFSHTDGTPWGRDFCKRILGDEKWKMIYLDEHSFILAKNIDSNREMISKFEIKKSDFGKKAEEIFENTNFSGKFAIADFFLQAGEGNIARKLAEHLVAQSPNNFQAKILLGQILSQSEDRDDLKKAEELFSQAISQGAKLSSAYNSLGIVSAKRGDFLAAKRAWEKALQINPQDEWSKFYLSSVP
jgi:hypothetical protein